MQKVISIFVLTLMSLAIQADDFQWEAGLEYGSESIEFSAPLFIGFGPSPSPLQQFTVDTDIDTTSIFGRWYLSPVNDSRAPMSRAAFASRASFLSFSYRQSDATTRINGSQLTEFPPAIILDPLPIIGPLPEPTVPVILAPGPAIETDDFSFEARYVFDESNWYILGGATVGSASVDSIPDSDIDITVLTVGGGLYIGDWTTIDLSIISSDADGNFVGSSGDDATDVAVNFSHIGKLGDSWQFGVDAGVVFTENGDDPLRLQGSLFPNRQIAFGLSIETRSDDFLDDGSRYTVFGSWFVNPALQLSASIGRDDVSSPPGTDTESEQFRLGVLARF